MEINYRISNKSFKDLLYGDTFTCSGHLYVKCHHSRDNSYNAYNLVTNTVAFVTNSDRISPCKATITVE